MCGFVFVPCFILQCFVPFYFSYHLDGYTRAACFTLVVLLMSCDFECSVSLPHGAVDWSAVCSCGIS